MGITLFHACKEILTGDIRAVSSSYNEFGSGFYLYTSLDSALLRLEGTGGYVYQYNFNDKLLRGIENVKFPCNVTPSGIDYISGSSESLVVRLLKNSPNVDEDLLKSVYESSPLQYCLKSKEACDNLTYMGRLSVTAKESAQAARDEICGIASSDLYKDFWTTKLLGDTCANPKQLLLMDIFVGAFMKSIEVGIDSVNFIESVMSCSDVELLINNANLFDMKSSEALFDALTAKLSIYYPCTTQTVYSKTLMRFIALAYAEAVIIKKVPSAVVLKIMPLSSFMSYPALFM